MPRTLSFMGLHVWDQLLDDYDHTQLGDNWSRVDNHDHTPGRGVQLTNQSIAPNSIATNQIINEAVTREKVEKPLLEFLEHPLRFASHATSFTAASGELVKATAAITVTTPVAVANATIGVIANGHEVKVKAGSGTINGSFTEGASLVNLVGFQFLVLQCDGTNWFIIAGEPKREQVYEIKSITKAELEAGIVFSATREVYVMNLEPLGGNSEFKIGGVSTRESENFIVPQGQTLKIKPTGAGPFFAAVYVR